MPKYTPENLIPALRHFVEARDAALKLGLTDNGGAIHSVTRIVELLSLAICYPGLSHINNLKSDLTAEISIAAHEAREQGKTIQIEHVMPQRAFSVAICDLIESGCSDTELIDYIRTTYRLVLLTPQERSQVDKVNRSKMTPDRIADAGIELNRGE